MIQTNLFTPTDARSVSITKGIFSVIEYERDMSVSPERAQEAYFAAQMGTRKRQLIANVNNDVGVITQKGTMQFMLGDLTAQTDVPDVGSLLRKFVGAKVTGETAIKPRYTGKGILVLEPTFRYIILEDMSAWDGDVIVEDGMFLACEDTVSMFVSSRSTLSSAVLGDEGLFNTTFTGKGIVALESPVPGSELFEIELKDDVVKIDGNMAIAWSKSLDFTVERTTATIVGSIAAGEGFVNVYRGTGKILIAPVKNNRGIGNPENNKKGI